MAMNDPTKPRNLLDWRGDIAQKQAAAGLKPDPVPARVTTVTAPGEARGAALVRDALNPQNIAANRAEAMPFANQVSGPRYSPDGTGRQQGGAGTPPPLLARPAAATPAAAAAPAAAAVTPTTTAPAAPKPTTPAPKDPGVKFNTGQPGDVQPPTQPTVGSFTGSDGVRRDFTRNQIEGLAGKLQTAPSAAVPPAPSAPAGVNTPPPLTRPTPTAIAQGVAQGIRGQALSARNDAAQALNPISAQGELLRRLENSQNSYFNKGSPSARAFAAEAILGQMRAGNAASAAGQAGANAALQQGGAGEIAAGAQANELNDREAARTQQATLTREALDAQAPTVTLANGTAARAGRDGIVRGLRGEDGQPVALKQDTKALDPNEVFKAVTAAQQAILTDPTMTAEARAAAQAELAASPAGQAVAALLSSPQSAQASQIPPAAIEMLRANPDKAAEFDQTFGAGAAARYLGN